MRVCGWRAVSESIENGCNIVNVWCAFPHREMKKKNANAHRIERGKVREVIVLRATVVLTESKGIKVVKAMVKKKCWGDWRDLQY